MQPKIFPIALSLSIILTIFNASAMDCSIDSLITEFQKANVVSGAETFRFDSGWQQPTCSFEAITSRPRKQRDLDAKAAIEEIPDSIFHPEFKKYLLDSDDNYTSWTGDMSSGSMPWPPNKPGKAKDAVTLEQRQEYERQTMTDEQIQRLKKATSYFGYKQRAEEKERLKFNRKINVDNIQKRFELVFKIALEKSVAFVKTEGTRKLEPSILDAALIRLKTLTLSPSPNREDIICGEIHTAMYQPLTHQVAVPYSAAFLTNESLLRIMAHEISHSIDRENISHPIAPFKSSDPSKETNSRVREARILSGAKYIILDPEQNAPDYFKSAGPILNNGVESKKYPFQSVYTCLSKNETLYADRDFQGIQQNQHEAFADWFAAEIVAAVMTDPVAIKTLRSTAGDIIADRESEKLVSSILPAGYEFVSFYVDRIISGDNDDQEHPRWSSRLSEIYLAHPTIRQFLGCENKKAISNKCSW